MKLIGYLFSTVKLVQNSRVYSHEMENNTFEISIFKNLYECIR